MNEVSFHDYKLIQLKTEKHYSFLCRQINLNSDLDSKLNIFKQKVNEDCLNELDNKSEIILECIEHWVNHYQTVLKKINILPIVDNIFTNE